MRYLIILSAFLFPPVASISQSLYELKYHFDTPAGRDDYKALLLKNENGTGTIRVAFTDRKYNSRNIFEIEMQEGYDEDDKGNVDKSMLVYVGLDDEPKKIIGNAVYSPDHFVFELNKETNFYEPSLVLSIHKNGKESVGVFDSKRLLDDKDLSREFLLQYFMEDEEEFQNFFDVAKTRGLTLEEKQTTQLHLVIVANTEEDNIGATCMVDRKAILKLYTQVANTLGIPIKSTVIDGTNYSKQNVVAALDNIKPNANDIVVFYYSGHGFNLLNSPKLYPYLDLRSNSSDNLIKDHKINGDYSVNIENVYDEITKKGARLNLVISDCCNNLPENSNTIFPDEATTRSSSLGWNLYNCKTLFMNPQPLSILITAASKGELSAGKLNTGGIFTFNLRETLEATLGNFATNVSWDALVKTAKEQTAATAKKTKCEQPDKKYAACSQIPVFRMSHL